MSVITAPNAISAADRRFAQEYFRNGHNGARAYLAIHPTVTYDSASTLASKILKKIQVLEYIDSLVDSSELTSIASKRALTLDAHEIYLANRDERPQVALNALQVKARLHRLYDRDPSEPGGYVGLMQQLNVQVVVGERAAEGMAGEKSMLQGDAD
jgi:phage terminase small subunit